MVTTRIVDFGLLDLVILRCTSGLLVVELGVEEVELLLLLVVVVVAEVQPQSHALVEEEVQPQLHFVCQFPFLCQSIRHINVNGIAFGAQATISPFVVATLEFLAPMKVLGEEALPCVGYQRFHIILERFIGLPHLVPDGAIVSGRTSKV